jgi:integrase
MRRKIAAGSVYARGQIFWLKYYVPGRKQPVRESAETTDKKEAERLLRQRMAKAYRGAEYSEKTERVVVNQLFDLILEDYRLLNRATTYDIEMRINKHLRPYFGNSRAGDVTSASIRKYTTDRVAVAQPATVNKELSYLRRAFRLGLQNEPPLVERVPYIRMLRVDNAREGIIEHETYRAIRDSLPSYARIAFVISYHTGSRKGEIGKIRLDKIDLKRSRIDLPGRTTKNGKPRYLPIYGDMAAELSMAISLADPGCPFLVQKDGARVEDWEKSWATACSLAGADDALFHDLRRTALTNMIEAGFSEKEAMEISGHLTRAVFDRYHIVSERRLKQLSERMEAHMREKDAALGTIIGHRDYERKQ